MLLPLLAALACNRSEPEGEPATTPDPWEALEPVALDPFREIASASLAAETAPASLRTLPERSLSFVLSGGVVLALDARYHHDPSGRCVDASGWPELLDATAQGACPEGSAWTQRGKLATAAPIVSFAVDRASLRLALLTDKGGLGLADADVLSGDPLDLLRPGEVVSLETGPLSEATVSAMEGEDLWVADGASLWRLDPSGGAIQETHALPGEAQALLLRESRPWVLTSAGLWADGETLTEPLGLALAATDDTVWVGAEDGLWQVDTEQLEVEFISVPGATGPLTVDEATGRVWAATSAGLASLQDGLLTQHNTDPVSDLAMNSAGELVALGEAGQIRVYVDETSLTGAEPLDLLIAAFIERPRGPKDSAPCTGETESVAAFAATAADNAAVLADQPLPVALGLTPNFARRARACEVIDVVAPLLSASNTEPGVLFHALAEDCTDQACLADFLASEAAELTALGLDPTWASGLAPQDALSLDWVLALDQAGGPGRYLFFGLSTLPEITGEDPRAKDAWPLAAGERASAWRVGSAETVAEHDPSGSLSVYPGDNTPLFNLGNCPNLLLEECHLSNMGGGTEINADDVSTLALLLHRAVAERDGVSTFTFHLPDLGVYDYTQGCTVTDRVWSGEGCEAALLQAFGFDVVQRYVANGLVRLRLPSELDTP